jgi:hypothetical protein
MKQSKSATIQLWNVFSYNVVRVLCVSRICFGRIRRKHIYSVLEGKVNIPGAHSVIHCKQKRLYVHVSYPNCFQDRDISMYSSKIVDKKEILCTVSKAGIYCSSDKVGTVYLV